MEDCKYNISVESGMYDVNVPAYGYQRYYNTTGVSQLSSQLSDGWRVATYIDYQALYNAVNYDPSALCASSPDWSGTNISGFTALPLGIGIYTNGSYQFHNIGNTAYFYESGGNTIYMGPSTFNTGGAGSDEYYCSVRLCKDAT